MNNIEKTIANLLNPQNKNVYGFCPICGSPGKTRERRMNGDDICEKGHKYPSKDSVQK
jgi:hypothetical protein